LAEKIESTRQDVIDRAVAIVGEEIQKYHGPEVHCKETSDKEMMSGCDAFQLGSLLRAASAIGIWPAPAGPYNAINWKSVSAKICGMKVTSLCESPLARGYSRVEHGVMPKIVRQIKHLDKLMRGLPLEFQS
jgi:hypothetical protein